MFANNSGDLLALFSVQKLFKSCNILGCSVTQSVGLGSHAVRPVYIYHTAMNVSQNMTCSNCNKQSRSAETIIGAHLPLTQDLYRCRVRKWPANISADPSRPGHNLFRLLASLQDDSIYNNI
ncbi:hypothetical protein ILYODFUR_025449 [Ilyodon furcidens]|uniref:Uncharacterized protein n=1 Tax=Ilyodon furcidens TaxID=33524 RepID=A0ABV0VI12_9TELE